MPDDQGQVLGLVPARGGSKGVPRKNLASVAGQPLIRWTIRTARDCPSIERLICSTDNSEIANEAQRHGAETPFLRPKELARDDTPGIEPVLHAIRWLEANESYLPQYVMVLQPTSPFRTANDIAEATRVLEVNDAKAVVSVSPVSQHPFWMKQITDSGRLVNFQEIDALSYSRRQDLPPVYGLNGAIYLARRDVLLERESWYTEETYAYVMPEDRSLEIDTEWDLYLADLVLRDKLGDGV